MAKSIDKKLLMFITGLSSMDANGALALLSKENKIAMYVLKNGQYILTEDPEKCVFIIPSPQYASD